MKKTYLECGCCGEYHEAGTYADCRNDEQRFTREKIAAMAYTIILENYAVEIEILTLEDQQRKI